MVVMFKKRVWWWPCQDMSGQLMWLMKTNEISVAVEVLNVWLLSHPEAARNADIQQVEY
jgi:hypothetical protein